MKKTIAIQGYSGSFHHLAAINQFGQDIDIEPCSTFRELFRKTQYDHEISIGLAAFENSIAGSILNNYSLLQKSSLMVTGEVYLPVAQHLLALPGVKTKDIKEVHSHTMALHQCAEFLDQFPWKQVESEDTAYSARHISENRIKYAAAIGSSLAATLYHLRIIEENIHTEKTNYTRFLILQRNASIEQQQNANKASVYFELPHQPGALARVLSIIASCKVNLSSIQSIPIAKNAWNYAFHADMEFDNIKTFNSAISKITDHTKQLIIYGVYKQAEKVSRKDD